MYYDKSKFFYCDWICNKSTDLRVLIEWVFFFYKTILINRSLFTVCSLIQRKWKVKLISKVWFISQKAADGLQYMYIDINSVYDEHM